jgi:pimeloyl-ACP methyl ester carboxylesterase
LDKKDKTPLVLKVVRWGFPIAERFMPELAHWFFVKLFFSPLHYKIPVKEKKAISFADKFTLQITDKSIQCYAWGKSEKIVLLVHGWGGRATQFRRFVKPLMAAGYKVIGFDGPAHGNSSGRKTSLFEFEETLKKIYEQVGVPHAIIAHSFGGGAVLFSAMNGLSVSKLINIASPSIGDEIINTYLRAINGSSKTGEFFKGYILETTHKSFDEFTSLYFVKHLPKRIDLLLVHDENDKEVSIEHANALLDVYPQAGLYKTKGLGHTRILKNDAVIQYCVTYISN